MISLRRLSYCVAHSPVSVTYACCKRRMHVIAFSRKRARRALRASSLCPSRRAQVSIVRSLHKSAMASSALRRQVATKWQDAFNRLNRSQPGISGLMGFSQVRSGLPVVKCKSNVHQAWLVATKFLYPRNPGDPPREHSTSFFLLHTGLWLRALRQIFKM